MNIASVQKMIRRAKGGASIRALADYWNVDHAYLYRMMVGEREPSDEVLTHLGLERFVVYRRKHGNGR